MKFNISKIANEINTYDTYFIVGAGISMTPGMPNFYMLQNILYVLGVITGEYDSKLKAARMLEKINLDGYSSIILTDCDKTLSYEDTTDTWLKLTNKDGSRLKEIYKYDRYTNYQALEAKYFLGDGDIVNGYKCDPTLIKNNITLNKELITDLKTKFNTKVLAITAGNSSLWQELLNGEGLNAEVLDANLIMSKFVKYFVLKALQEKGKYVIAIGDSMLPLLYNYYTTDVFLSLINIFSFFVNIFIISN